MYIDPCSSNPAVRAVIAYHLRAAAQAELLKTSATIDIRDLHREAENAFKALSTLLGEQTWFFGGERPSLFDASVFAYTHPLLDPDFGWKEERLSNSVKNKSNLVRHRDHILLTYYN